MKQHGWKKVAAALFAVFYISGAFAQSTELIELCVTGVRGACRETGKYFRQENRLDVAAHFYRRACDLGDVNSCGVLAYFYIEGIGVQQSYRVAANLLRKACDSGLDAGCNSLGVLYEKGQDVPQSYLAAAHLYRKACDLGNATSCYSLGNFFMEGLGVSLSEVQAKEFYAKACILFDDRGCKAYTHIDTEK